MDEPRQAAICAATLCAEGRYEEAHRVLTDALRQDEHAHALRYELGQVEAQLGHLTSAERLAREAVAAGGDAYARGLGNILGRLGKLDEAESWLLRAVEYDAGDASAYAGLAAACADRCRVSEALAYVERALAIQPDFPWADAIR